MNEETLKSLSKYLWPMPENCSLKPYPPVQYAVMMDSDTGALYLAPAIYTPLSIIIAKPDIFSGKHVAVLNSASVPFFEDIVLYPKSIESYNKIITYNLANYMFGLLAYLYWYSFRHSETEDYDDVDHEKVIRESIQNAGTELAAIFVSNGIEIYNVKEEAFLFAQKFVAAVRLDMFLPMFWSALVSGVNRYLENKIELNDDDDPSIEIDRDVWGFFND